MIEDLIHMIKEYEDSLKFEFDYMDTLGVEEDIEEIDECAKRIVYYQEEIRQCCKSIEVLARLN